VYSGLIVNEPTWQGDVVKLVEFLRCSLPFSVTKDLFRHVLLNLLSNVPYPYYPYYLYGNDIFLAVLRGGRPWLLFHYDFNCLQPDSAHLVIPVAYAEKRLAVFRHKTLCPFCPGFRCVWVFISLSMEAPPVETLTRAPGVTAPQISMRCCWISMQINTWQ